MRNRITLKKLRSQQGETLVEVLVAILVSSLGMLMLATAISHTTRIVTTSKTVMNDCYANQTALVKKEADGGSDVTKSTLEGKQIQAKINGTSVSTEEFNVTVFQYPCGNQTIRLYDSWSSS